MNLNDFIYKINSPELEAHFEQFGKQFYIDADEINSIVDTLKLMSNNVASSGFIEKKAHGIFGQEYVIAAFFKWAIENNLYSNLTQVTLAIPYAAAGKTRFERIAATTEDTFIRVVGEESSAAAVLPDLPADTLELTHYLVRDNAIDNPIPVVPVGTFVEKATYTPMTLTNAGVVGSFEMDKRAAIKATGALTELGNIIKNNSTHHFPGQLFVFIDATPAGGVNLPHLYTGGGPGSIAWFHPDGEDYVTQQGEVVLFVEDTVGSQTVNRRISSSLQQKSVTLDKIQDIASGTILGRLSAGDGQPEPLDWIDVLFLLGLEDVVDQVNDIEDSIGVANGLATLDASGKIPAGQLPNSVMTLEGNWNATTNTPPLSNGTGNAGDVLEVTFAGVRDFGDGIPIGFSIGDFAVYGANGKWYNSPNTFPTKEVVTSATSFTLNASFKGKTIRFTGSTITMTVPPGLGLNFEVFLDNDTTSNIVIVAPDGSLTIFAPSGLKLVGGGTGYLTMTTTTRVSIKGDFID